MSSGVELGGVTSLPSFLGPQLGLVSAHLLTFFSRSDGKQDHCTGLVLMPISYDPIPNQYCPTCHVFAYNRANTRMSVLKKLDFSQLCVGKAVSIKLFCFAEKTSSSELDSVGSTVRFKVMKLIIDVTGSVEGIYAYIH